MTGLKYTMGAMDPGTTRRAYGTAYHDGAKWWANMNGSLLDARWNASVRPEQGLNIAVDITNDGLGQSTALVICAYVDQPPPGTGTATAVLPAGPAVEIVFTGEDGVTYQTDQFIGSFNPGDPIYLNWDANKPTIMGKIGAVAAPPPPVAPPAVSAGAGNGQVKRIATASDTWAVGGWGRYATSRNGGEDVYSGSWSGTTTTGSWFYGAPDPVLAGKTITGIQFYVPARLPGVGGYNSAATIHLYAHDAWGRPGTDVNRVVGPHDFSVPAGWRGGWIDLPLTFAPALASGGGISIAGNPYIGFESRLDNPDSGKTILNWSS